MRITQMKTAGNNIENARICELYEIDEDALYCKADESEYWSSCASFYESVKNKRIDLISQKQRDWLEKIEIGLQE